MAATSTVLILGSGPRIGAAISETFAANGYKVAVAARKGTDSKTDKGFLSIKADFTQPESVAAVFDAVKAEFGAAPDIVIYNAAALTPPSNKESAFSITTAKVTSDLNVNVVSPYVAAQEAIKGWATLPAQAKKTLIYTGNIQNEAVLPVPMTLNLGVGKAASAYWVGFADSAYSAQGYRSVGFDPLCEETSTDILGLLGSFTPMSATQMASLRAWPLTNQPMATSMHSWRSLQKVCRGTPRS